MGIFVFQGHLNIEAFVQRHPEAQFRVSNSMQGKAEFIRDWYPQGLKRVYMNGI